MTLKFENLSQTEIDKIIHIDSLDWELLDADTRYATHGYHPYSAKYIPQIPNYLIKNFSEKNDLILDNFMGSGTTLVEAKILGRNALGIDVNPLACLISNAKTINLQCSQLKEISDISASIKQDILAILGSVTLVNFGDNRKTIDESVINGLHPNIWKWFHKNVIYELFVIKNKIQSLESKHIRDFWCYIVTM